MHNSETTDGFFFFFVFIIGTVTDSCADCSATNLAIPKLHLTSGLL